MELNPRELIHGIRPAALKKLLSEHEFYTPRAMMFLRFGLDQLQDLSLRGLRNRQSRGARQVLNALGAGVLAEIAGR